MNVRNKIVAFTMSFIICFCTVSYSFCNDKEYINIENKERSALATLGGYVITKETFNIIVGVASACGVALLTENDAFDFVGNYINAWIKHSGKVDSGSFTTQPSKDEVIKEFETEIKNGSSKDPKDPNKLIVGSSLIASFMSIFNFMSSEEESGVLIGSSVPLHPKEYSAYEEMEAGKVMHIRLFDGTIFSWRFMPDDKDIHKQYIEYSILNNGEFERSINMRRLILKYIKCGEYKSCNETRCLHYKQENYYHLHMSSGANHIGLKPKGSDYYIDFYIPTKKYMSSYTPINKDVSVLNKDVPNSTNPNVSVGGVLDIPGGSAPGGSGIDFEMPPVPGFDDEGMDLSFLTDLFEHLKGKFPFSIPFDLYNLIDVLRTEPIPPKFDFKFLDNEIFLDLTQFEDWANIVRAFSVFSWVFVLFTFTKKLGG